MTASKPIAFIMEGHISLKTPKIPLTEILWKTSMAIIANLKGGSEHFKHSTLYLLAGTLFRTLNEESRIHLLKVNGKILVSLWCSFKIKRFTEFLIENPNMAPFIGSTEGSVRLEAKNKGYLKIKYEIKVTVAQFKLDKEDSANRSGFLPAEMPPREIQEGIITHFLKNVSNGKEETNIGPVIASKISFLEEEPDTFAKRFAKKFKIKWIEPATKLKSVLDSHYKGKIVDLDKLSESNFETSFLVIKKDDNSSDDDDYDTSTPCSSKTRPIKQA